MLRLKSKTIIFALIAVFASTGMLAGCSSSSSETAAVQSVAYLAGLGSIGTQERFAGVTCAKSEETIKSDKQKTILEILVKEGDTVTAGQSLCTYDTSLASLNLEKAQLELTQMQDSLTDKQAEKTTLEQQKAAADESSQLEYTLEIQKCDTEIREYEYNINLKKKDVESLEKTVSVGECTATVAGRIKSITGADSTDSSTSTEVTFVITEAGDYRVMGYVNENNSKVISEGMEVTVRSRVSDDTWSGTIQSIDWESGKTSSSDGSDSSSSDDTLTQTSKYPFYVQLDSSEGLLLGQHVYIEPKAVDLTSAQVELQTCYFFNVDGDSAYVWAENSSGRLEKRNVKISQSEDEDMYIVESGLTALDYIAFPSDDLKSGMKCEEYEGETTAETSQGDSEEISEEDTQVETDAVTEEDAEETADSSSEEITQNETDASSAESTSETSAATQESTGA